MIETVAGQSKGIILSKGYCRSTTAIQEKKSDTSGSMYDGVDMYGREWKQEDGET